MQIKMSEWGRKTLNVWNVCFLQTHLVKADLLRSKRLHKADLELNTGKIIVCTGGDPQSTAPIAIN